MLYRKWSIVHLTTRTVYASVVLSLLHSRSPCHSLMCTPGGSTHAEKSIHHTCVHQTSIYVSHFLVRIVSFTAAPGFHKSLHNSVRCQQILLLPSLVSAC